MKTGPPLSPGSAHTVVRIRPVTVPSAYRTVALSCCTVPEWMPVVLPRRVTVLPTAGVPA